ncbi:hypothetical protein BDA96_02G125900 [Sorghum bicolor]|uniref:Secreted protein n=1 Tax=Sorghum bicolor TaxID=4558 RepID=A0A921RPA3_SORBI|nr:hypothetical protein BDA96_02G125900 [Sorghum bicolor]
MRLLGRAGPGLVVDLLVCMCSQVAPAGPSLLPRVAASAGAGRTTGTRPARPRPPHTTLWREGREGGTHDAPPPRLFCCDDRERVSTGCNTPMRRGDEVAPAVTPPSNCEPTSPRP